MPGRIYSSDTYRYGFNGQEKDDEIKNQNQSLTFAYRILDTRLARFLSVDPLHYKFSELSTYQFASNTPLVSKDLEGLESDAWGWLGYSGFHPYATPEQQRQEMLTGWAVLKACFTTKKGLKRTLTGTAEMMRGALAGVILIAATELVTGGLGSATIAEELAPRIVTSTTRAMEATSAEDAVIVSRLKPTEITPDQPQISVTEANIFSNENINLVRNHVAQFDAVENQVMLSDLEKISCGEMKATEIHENYVRHELREAELMNNNVAYREAHETTLKEQGMYHKDYEKKLYTKEALDAGDKARIDDVNKKM